MRQGTQLQPPASCVPTFPSWRPQRAIDHILARAKAHGVVAGIHNGTPEYALKMVEKGFQFVTIASDAGRVGSTGEAVYSAAKGGIATPLPLPMAYEGKFSPDGTQIAYALDKGGVWVMDIGAGSS